MKSQSWISIPQMQENKHVKETLQKHKLHIKLYTEVLRDFNTSLSPMDRPTWQELNRETRQLTDVMIQMDITRRLQNIPPKHKRTYILLSTSWTFSKIDPIHGDKANLNRHTKKLESSSVSYQITMFFFNFSLILCAQEMKNLSHL